MQKKLTKPIFYRIFYFQTIQIFLQKSTIFKFLKQLQNPSLFIQIIDNTLQFIPLNAKK